MLLANPYTHDTRVHKQAQTLIGWGLEVHVVCIAKPQLPVYEIKDAVHVHRVAVNDESVFRVLRGVARLGSRERLGDWLDQDFSLAEPPVIPTTTIQPPTPPTPTTATVVSVEQHDGASLENERVESEAHTEEGQIQSPGVDEPQGEPTSWRLGLLRKIAGWSQRSAEGIAQIEGCLISVDSDSILSKESGLAVSKPVRVVVHGWLWGRRKIHRVLVYRVSRWAKLRLPGVEKSVRIAHAAELKRAVEHAEARRVAQMASARKQEVSQARKVEQSEQKYISHDQQAADALSANMDQEASDRNLVARSRQVAHAQQMAKQAKWKRRLRKVIKRIPSAVRIIGFNDELARKAKTLEPDLVLSHDCNTLLAGRMLKTVIGCPLVYDSHELFLERNIGSRRRWVDKFCWWPIERGCIKSADAVFTVAEGIARHLEKQYGIDEVYLLRNVQPYEPPPVGVAVGGNGTLMHQELGLDPATRIVIYPGAITINRGIEFLIQASPLLDNAVVVVMGYANSAGYMEQMIEMARSNGSLGTSFFFKDAVPIDEVGRWVACADLGVVPTQGVCLSYRFEASNKMFHCLMAGVPLAMSNHPEKRILADRYGVGIVFDETSAESIARAINETLYDHDALEWMRANCLEAAKTLNWEHEEHRYLGVYAGLLPGHDRLVPSIHIGEGASSDTPESGGLGAEDVEVVVEPEHLRVGTR